MPHPKETLDTDNFTRIPQAVFDEVAPKVKGSTVKILMYLFRKTWGEGNDSVHLSYRQITAGTGVNASSTVGNAIKKLSEPIGDAPAPLNVYRDRGGNPNEYEINPRFVIYARNYNRESEA